MGVEEKWAAKILGEIRLRLRVGDDGRELMQVAEEQELHAAERLVGAPAVEPQHGVDALHEIGPHHRHLVDDQRVEAAHDGPVTRLADVGRTDEARRQAEKGMNRLAADIHAGEPRRRQNGDALAHLGPQRPEQGRFAGPCAPGDEQVALAPRRKSERRLELDRRLDPFGP